MNGLFAAAERPQVVQLEPHVPVWLAYTTALAGPDGRLGFFENIYSRDAAGGGVTR